MKLGNYTAKWKHFNGNKPIEKYTICNLFLGEAQVSKGLAELSQKDSYCKDTGRKVSLAKAMAKGNISKPERKAIWDAYRDSKNGGRW